MAATVPVEQLQPAPTPSFPPPPDPRLLNQPVSVPRVGGGLRGSRFACEEALRVLITLQRSSGGLSGADFQVRLRDQLDAVLTHLQSLRRDVSALVKAGESYRLRRWLLGGFIAAFVPVVRRIFRRPVGDEESSNDTEYAFNQSKSLLTRVIDSVHSKGAFASVAMFVLSVLYVFQAEVSLRVAKTVSKRLKRLTAKIERGQEPIGDDDLSIIKGWRWRVLMWKS
ncbi:hypothetical protein BX600DRAFT_98634 [Xylariales sp. PMI_506]|nr:hypothetical protein BX600DRAFT_98634 [Xylariales sp. PMI_506]